MAAATGGTIHRRRCDAGRNRLGNMGRIFRRMSPAEDFFVVGDSAVLLEKPGITVVLECYTRIIFVCRANDAELLQSFRK
jgi:hypothetical protein